MFLKSSENIIETNDFSIITSCSFAIFKSLFMIIFSISLTFNIENSSFNINFITGYFLLQSYLSFIYKPSNNSSLASYIHLKVSRKRDFPNLLGRERKIYVLSSTTSRASLVLSM